MKLTKSKLKQIIKEELSNVLKEGDAMGHHEAPPPNRFELEYNQLKAELQKEWEENDQQVSGTWQSPEKITASVIQYSNMEDEDLHHLVSDAVEEYNQTHEDEIHIDMDEVYEELHSQGYADYQSQREDEATNPW